jgi:molybdopterin/thiamine biosynthesis adenylyltransferase
MSISLEDGRYDRQELITWWDQSLLRRARVLVVGAGALGNEVMKNLALIGVGNLTVIDLDTVERSNLARCIFFRESDNGRHKAPVVAEAVRELNPDLHVTSIVGDVTAQGLGWLKSFDLVVGALDNREARVWVNQACRKLGLTWIDGAIEGLRGVVKVFPPDGACYECTLGEQDREILARRRSCTLLSSEELLTGKVPTTATSSSMVAGFQAQEVVRLLHDQDSPLANSGWMFIGESADSFLVSYTPDDDCLAHDRYLDINVIEYAPTLTAADLIAASGLDDVDAIDFELEILLSVSCAPCNYQAAVNSRIDTADAAFGRCPKCGDATILNAAVALAPGDPACSVPLAELGIPITDFVTVRSGERRVHYQLGSAE